MREILTSSGEGKAVAKLPCARKRERKNTLCSALHMIVSRDMISEIHTRETLVSYVTPECHQLIEPRAKRQQLFGSGL